MLSSKSTLRYAVPGVALAGVVASVAPSAAATAAPSASVAPSVSASPVAPTATPSPTVSPTPTPSPSASSTVYTVVVKTRHVHHLLRFHTTYVHSHRLYRGHHRLRRHGHNGRVDRWWSVTYVNGHYDHRVLLRTHRRHARNRIVVVGTKSRLHWHALAACESSNRTHIADPPYYGLYQFDISTWRSVGGHGLPSSASRAEQTKRARILFHHRGRAPWPVCGTRL